MKMKNDKKPPKYTKNNETMEIPKKINKKELAARLGLSLYLLNREIEYMLQDETISKEYGKYRNRYFRQYQLRIIERETNLKIFPDDPQRND
jgi:hypothetical protein